MLKQVQNDNFGETSRPKFQVNDYNFNMELNGNDFENTR